MEHPSIPRFFWEHIRPYRWYYVVMLLAPIFGSFYPFLYNYSIKLFLDQMTEANETALTFKDVLFPIFLFILNQLLHDFFWRISNVAEWHAEPYVRRSILEKSYDFVQHHGYRFFQNNYTGSVSSKIKGLLDGYDKFWEEIHRGLFGHVFKTIVNLSALCFINLNLGLFIFLWVCVYAPIMYKLSLNLNRYSFEENKSKHIILGHITDRLSNIFTLLAFSRRQIEQKKLHEEISNDYVPKQVRTSKYDFKLQIIGGCFYIIMFTFILFYMIHLKQQGTVTIGDFAFVLGLTLIIAESVWLSTVSLQDFSRAMGDLKSSLSVLDITQQDSDPEGSLPLKLQKPSISFKNVSFKHPDSEIFLFEDLNIYIKPGEKVGLVGPSGSGKSTIVNLLLRYFTPQTGQILIDNTDISTTTQDSLRDHIALIPQDTSLFHRSIFENIHLGKPDSTQEEVINAAKKAHIHDLIMTLPGQYKFLVGERGIKLSGGQKQRISIARAILKNSPLLVLDEATSALDSLTETYIQESLEVLIKDSQRTVIAIAHRLSTLKNMDRIIVLRDGKIIEEGTHETLIKSPHGFYRKMWENQSFAPN